MILSNDELLIDDLREGFRRYLEAEYPHIKNKSVTLSDAFYLQRHNIGISFWEALRNEGTMEQCREKLEEYFKDVRKMKSLRSNSFTYMSSIKILKEYIVKTFGGVHRESNDISDEYENIIPDYGQGNVPPLPSFLPQNDNKCTRKRQPFTTPYLCIINEHTKRCDIVYTEVFFYGSLSKDTRTTQGRD